MNWLNSIDRSSGSASFAYSVVAAKIVAADSVAKIDAADSASYSIAAADSATKSVGGDSAVAIYVYSAYSAKAAAAAKSLDLITLAQKAMQE